MDEVENNRARHRLDLRTRGKQFLIDLHDAVWLFTRTYDLNSLILSFEIWLSPPGSLVQTSIVRQTLQNLSSIFLTTISKPCSHTYHLEFKKESVKRQKVHSGDPLDPRYVFAAPHCSLDSHLAYLLRGGDYQRSKSEIARMVDSGHGSRDSRL